MLGYKMRIGAVLGCFAIFLTGYAFHAAQTQATASTGFDENEISAANKSDAILAAVQRLSLNAGLYDNKIRKIDYPQAYVEFCFKDGFFLSDDHPAGGTTEGGRCLPGDRGWIIEKMERLAATWALAKAECLKLGMRMPEFFEFQLSCQNAGMVGIADMTNNSEWASNSADLLYAGGESNGLVSVVTGFQGCARGDIGWAARSDHLASVNPYRCSL